VNETPVSGGAVRFAVDFCQLTLMLSLGELQSVDGYMNIALEKTEEYVNGVKRRTYGDAFVRGNNGKRSSLVPPAKLPPCQD